MNTTPNGSITATARADGTGSLHLDGVEHTVTTTSLEEARTAIMQLVADEARKTGNNLQVLACEPGGEWPVVVTPDGQVHTQPRPQATAATPTPRTATPVAFPQATADRPAGTSARAGQSFLPQAAPAPGLLPVDMRTGWRGFLARLGLRPPLSADEQAYLNDVAAVSQHWPGTRTIVVCNPKGGSNKTPTVILLSAVLARFGGGGVCAWGNHQMRGTLGWRVVQGPHQATTRDLLNDAEALAAGPGRAGDLARYTHHQPGDKFDVLRNNPDSSGNDERFNHTSVTTLHKTLSKYYRLIVIDSDNDESSPHWMAMVGLADQMIVATTTDDVSAEAGRLMLDSLLDGHPHQARLAQNAVVVVSQSAREDTPAAEVAGKFASRGLATATLPYDAGMRRLHLAFDQLQPDTQRSAIHAAAVIAANL